MMQKKWNTDIGAILFGVSAAAAWAVGPVLSRSVRDYFSVSFQNLARFTVSLLVLWGFTLLRIGVRETGSWFKKIPRLVLKSTVPAVGLFMFQFLYIAGIYRLYTTVAALAGNSSVLISVFLAYLFFHDERGIIRSHRFQAGFFLAIGGMAIIILAGRGTGGTGEALGIVFILLSALAWSLHSIFLKKWLSDVPVTLATAIIFSINAFLFLIVCLLGKGNSFSASIPPGAWLVLVASGFISIGLGNTFFFASIPRLGVTVANSLTLLIPLFTVLFSWIVLGELMLPLQAAGGAGLLWGCFLIIKARYRINS